MDEKRILLIVGGGIAAYKSLELTRLLRKAGVGVRPILTEAAAEFVTPLSLSALAEDKVYSELFSLTDEAEMGHIELSRSADLVVVAPATADLMAKAANGLANDLASTTLLATDKAVLMAPAMNVRMWEHAATRRNLATLIGDGVHFVGPDEGAMACGEYGPGRMAEPPAIFEAIMGLLGGGPPARGQTRRRHRRPYRRGYRSGARAHQPLLGQAGLRHRERAGGPGRGGHPGQRPHRPAGPRRREPRQRRERPRDAGRLRGGAAGRYRRLRRGRGRLAAGKPRRPQDQEGRRRPADHHPHREPPTYLPRCRRMPAARAW